ncbi:hypothetical protein [Campylobacter ureolyticus]|uniref:hypothetical protein n=1 Tax=Campylobacter ureolyticus TaxID=827 RepID=UPI0026ED068D|nr:hypothetical protein [Campylobacter ureolyticus]
MKILNLIIINLFLYLNLNAETITLNFKENNKTKEYINDLNIYGKWNLKSINYTHFIMTIGQNWDLEFKKSDNFLYLNEKNRNLYWKFENEYIVIYHKKSFSIYSGDEIKLTNYAGNKCFDGILNNSSKIKFCKTEGKILNNMKKIIKIENY